MAKTVIHLPPQITSRSKEKKKQIGAGLESGTTATFTEHQSNSKKQSILVLL